MRGLLIGFQFLTRLPVRLKTPTSRQIAASYLFYPLIGAIIGGAGIAVRHLGERMFSGPFSIVLTIVFFVWITGGLHEDGLADVADGLGGAWSRERRLQIMKDSHIGAFGVVAIVLALLVKYSALTSMNPARVDRALLTAHMLGRWSFLPLGYFNPAAREGLGAEMIRHLNGAAVVAATLFTFAVSFLLSGLHGIGVAMLAAFIVATASAYFRLRLGGVTGDCFGATFHFVEIATYAAFLA